MTGMCAECRARCSWTRARLVALFLIYVQNRSPLRLGGSDQTRAHCAQKCWTSSDVGPTLLVTRGEHPRVLDSAFSGWKAEFISSAPAFAFRSVATMGTACFGKSRAGRVCAAPIVSEHPPRCGVVCRRRCRLVHTTWYSTRGTLYVGEHSPSSDD